MGTRPLGARGLTWGRMLYRSGVVLCSLVIVVTGSSSALAAQDLSYSGRTSTGARIEIKAVRGRGGLRLQQVSMATPIRLWDCEPGAHPLFRGESILWLGPGYLLEDDRTFEFGSGDSEFHLTGVLGPARASGELQITQGDCTTGAVEWEAHKTDPLT